MWSFFRNGVVKGPDDATPRMLGCKYKVQTVGGYERDSKEMFKRMQKVKLSDKLQKPASVRRIV